MSSGEAGRDVESLVKQAKSSLGQRQYDRADELSSQAIKLDPRNAPAYLVRAETRRKLGRPDQALADLAVSIRLDPERAPAYVVRAEILKKRCLFDQAIADATHALFLNPDNAAAYSIRAECRRAIGDPDGAAEDAQELVRIDPTRPIGPQASGPGLTRVEGSTPEDRFYKGASADRPDLRGDLFEAGQPADRSMKSKVIDGAEQAAESLAQSSGYKPGVIVRPMPRVRSHRGRPSRQAPWILIVMGGAVLFGGGLLWARKDQPKAAVETSVAILPMAPEAGPAIRSGPFAIPAATEAESGGLAGIRKKELNGTAKTPGSPVHGDRQLPADGVVKPETIGSDELHWVSVRNGNPARGRPVFRGEDGVLIGDGSHSSYFRTDEVFEDFTLRLDYWFPLQGVISVPGSGVLLMPPDREGNPIAGIECQVKPGETGDIYAFPGSTATGVLSPTANIDRDKIKHVGQFENPRGDWNTLEIRCEGRSLTVALNGQVVSHGLSDRPIRCRIALMSQGTVVNYRNLSITQLSPSPAPSMTVIEVKPGSEVANVTEINTVEREASPWLSPDGLTIYWTLHRPEAPEWEVWTARRKDLGSYFKEKRLVGHGRHIALSPDGLTMFLATRRADGKPGDSIQVSMRRSTTDDFGRPHEVAELTPLNMPQSLFLSADERTLLFNDGSSRDGTLRLMESNRGTPQERWGTPRPLKFEEQPSSLPICPHLSSDGLTLMGVPTGTQAGPSRRIVTWTRKATDRPFGSPLPLAIPGEGDLRVVFPRFVEATGELFLCSPRSSTDDKLDIWMVRNFKLGLGGQGHAR